MGSCIFKVFRAAAAFLLLLVISETVCCEKVNDEKPGNIGNFDTAREQDLRPSKEIFGNIPPPQDADHQQQQSLGQGQPAGFPPRNGGSRTTNQEYDYDEPEPASVAHKHQPADYHKNWPDFSRPSPTSSNGQKSESQHFDSEIPDEETRHRDIADSHQFLDVQPEDKQQAEKEQTTSDQRTIFLIPATSLFGPGSSAQAEERLHAPPALIPGEHRSKYDAIEQQYAGGYPPPYSKGGIPSIIPPFSHKQPPFVEGEIGSKIEPISPHGKRLFIIKPSRNGEYPAHPETMHPGIKFHEKPLPPWLRSREEFPPSRMNHEQERQDRLQPGERHGPAPVGDSGPLDAGYDGGGEQYQNVPPHDQMHPPVQEPGRQSVDRHYYHWPSFAKPNFPEGYQREPATGNRGQYPSYRESITDRRHPPRRRPTEADFHDFYRQDSPEQRWRAPEEDYYYPEKYGRPAALDDYGYPTSRRPPEWYRRRPQPSSAFHGGSPPRLPPPHYHRPPPPSSRDWTSPNYDTSV